MKYARIDHETHVVEVFTPPSGVEFVDCFHEDAAALFIPCPDEVEPFWTYNGKTFAAPVPIVYERVALGSQLHNALDALGATAAWEKAVAASDTSVQGYWIAGYRSGMPESNPKLARLASAAGVKLSDLFDKIG